MNLAERLEEALRRSGLSARELSRRALGNGTQFGVTLARLKKKPDSEVAVVTIRAIAKAAGVSEAWLLSESGSLDDPDDVQPYEARPPSPRAAGVRDTTSTYGTDRPFWRDLPDWPQLLAAAKLEDPEMPEAVWEKIERDLHYELDEEPTPSTLVGAAVWVRKNTRYWKLPARVETGGRPAAGGKGK